MKFKRFAAFAASMMLVMACCVPAYAASTNVDAVQVSAEDELFVDTAGCYFVAGNNVDKFPEIKADTFANDLFAAGSTVTLENKTVRGDAILAAQNINVNGLKTDGSLRVAGNTLSITKGEFGNNITAAGNSITVGSAVKCQGVYVAGNDIICNANAKAASLAGASVNMSATIDGDVYISADNVTIAKDTVIKGTLTVESANQPTIAEGAKIGHVEVKTPEQNNAAAGADVAGAMTMLSMYLAVLGLIMTIIMGLAICLLARRPVEASAVLTRKRLAWVIISGFVTMSVTPVVLIVLLLLGVTSLVSLFLLLVCLALGCICVPFTGIVLGRIVFKKMSPWPSALLGLLIWAVLSCIPVLGTFVFMLSSLFTCGVVIQALFLSLKRTGGGAEPPAPEAVPVVDAATPTPVAPVAPTESVEPTTEATPDTEHSEADNADGNAGDEGNRQ